ncbi:MAG: hypothetical protein ACREE6_04790 [Limisphaerales bacterium]
MKTEFAIYNLRLTHRGIGCASRLLSLFCFFLLAFPVPAQSANDSSTPDFSSFQIIVDRNIFNPDRYGNGPRHHEKPGVPWFSLAGTMSYRKGMFAFFDGAGDAYRKALEQGGKIAGYTVRKISFDGVQLESSGKTTEMNVGTAMRLEGGAWELSAPGDWGEMTATGSGTGSGPANETPEAPAASLPASGEQNDILKKLMEQRQQQEQELK